MERIYSYCRAPCDAVRHTILCIPFYRAFFLSFSRTLSFTHFPLSISCRLSRYRHSYAHDMVLVCVRAENCLNKQSGAKSDRTQITSIYIPNMKRRQVKRERMLMRVHSQS